MRHRDESTIGQAVARENALKGKLKGWVAGLSAEMLDAPENAKQPLQEALLHLTAAYRALNK